MIEGVAPGWYHACFSTELVRGKALPISIGGEELVLFRTEAGQVVAQARFCPHLGGNLAQGEVVGETLRCPFHFWRFDASGGCVEIPSCQKIPPKARVRTYPTTEYLEGVWIYVGDDPPYYQLPPRDELFFGREHHCGGRVDYGEIQTSARDILENAVDMAHGPCVHYVEELKDVTTEFTPTFLSLAGTLELEVYKVTTMRSRVVTSLYGPGLWVVQLSDGFFRFMPEVLIFLPTPLTARTTRLRTMTWICDAGWKPWVRLAGRLYASAARVGAIQDIEIWNHKIGREQPVLSAQDAQSPIMPFRRWYAELGRADSARPGRGAGGGAGALASGAAHHG